MDAAWARRLVVVALFVLLASSGSELPGGAVANAYGVNRPLQSYSFTMRGTIVMHTFPWLHIPIGGEGIYQRGHRYVVHLTHLPFFAKGFSRIDLSALAPRLWRSKFRVTHVGMHDGEDVYALRDPHDASVKTETVWVDPTRGIREVLVHYTNGGQLDLHVQCVEQEGYLVPGSTQARVDVPGTHLSVQVSFADYRMNSGRTLIGSAHTR